MAKKKPILLYGFVFAAAFLVLIQAIPYGKDHTNPSVLGEPTWDSPQTHELAERACFNCHSNHTVWPWYSNIAPASWLVAYDVSEGREHLNFSDWDHQLKGERLIKEIREVITEKEMPPLPYKMAHPEARLSDAERETLLQGLLRTLNNDSPEKQS